MTLQEYKKIKLVVNRFTQEISKSALKSGVDIYTPQFQLILDRAVKNFSKDAKFDYDEYKQIEDNGLKVAVEADNIFKEDKPIKWENINNKPKIITDNEVQGIISKEIDKLPKIEKRKSDIQIAIEASKMAQEAIKPLIPVIPPLPSIPTIEDIENDLPKLGERIRDGLELLKGEDRLDSSSIKNLPEVLEQNNNKIVSGYGGLNLYVNGEKVGATKTIDFTGAVSHSKVNGRETINIIDEEGAVDSVNGQTGDVVLDYTDVGAEPTKGSDENYVTDIEKSNLHAPHSDDQDLSTYATKSFAIAMSIALS